MSELPPDPANPYAPPSAGAQSEWSPSATAEAPLVPTSAPKVFGILSIIFASIVLLLGLLTSCGGLAAPFMTRAGEAASYGETGAKARQLRTTLAHMGSIYTAIGIQGLILTVMSALLLAIGIGQVRYRRWAGSWSVYWSSLALVALGGMIALSLLLIGPAYQRMFTEIAQGAPSGAMPTVFTSSMSSVFGGTSSVMLVLFYAPYPVLLLIFFTREHIRAAMNQ